MFDLVFDLAFDLALNPYLSHVGAMLEPCWSHFLRPFPRFARISELLATLPPNRFCPGMMEEWLLRQSYTDVTQGFL